MSKRDPSPALKDPPRGPRGRIQEKRSKYDLSMSSPCVKRRARPVEVEREVEEENSVVEELTEPAPVEEVPPTQKRVVMKACDGKTELSPCSRRNVVRNEHQLCSCNRRIDDTVVVPQNKRLREDRSAEQFIRMDPPCARQSEGHGRRDDTSPTLPTPAPRFFRPNAIPQLQRYYWDIGDTTDLEFKFSEQCKTVSSTDVRGFKVWRYWCQTFSMDCTVGDLVIFIEHNIEVPYAEYRIISDCRGKQEEILPTDWYKTLRCLLLYPKATIHLLPRQPNYVYIRLWISRLLLILLFPIVFLIMMIRCSIYHLIHCWNYL